MVDVKSGALGFILLSILVIKVIWVLALFSQFIDKKYYNNSHEQFILELEDIAYNLYTLLIGTLLIYLYNHLTPYKVCVEGYPKIYLYSFGILSCVGIIQKALHRYHFNEDLTIIEKYILGK